MHLLNLGTTLALAACALALPKSSRHVVHERRNKGSVWVPKEDYTVDKNFKLPVRIGLTQSNLHLGHDMLMKVSEPDSKDYGKHLSMEQIIELFASNDETVDLASDWLVSSGIDKSRFRLSPAKNWLFLNASVAEMEGLLRTEYKTFEHPSGQTHIACDEYSVPEQLKDHIDIILPTIHFDVKVVGTSDEEKELEKRDTKEKRKVAKAPGDPSNGFLPKKGKNIVTPDTDVSPQDTSTCNTKITPECLRALYGYPLGSLSKSSYGIVEYTPQAYLQSDLNLFYRNYATYVPSGTAPTLDSIDGGVDQTSQQGFNYNGESDLDLEYAVAIVYPQKVTLFQVGDIIESASFNNFLDGVDASYCNVSPGDDLTYDAQYPDPNAGGYKSKDCGKYAPTAVISSSYGYNEADLSPAYERRQCSEYMKLGMAGTTVLYSSGDYGVAGNGGQCCTKAKCAGGTYNNGGSGTFNPSFPGTCPYVTSVGATQIKPGASVTAPEEACETVIYSGGGFSNVFPLPSYQSSAVKSYFTNHKPPYTATQYNNSQTVRGYPDLSANGANYGVAVDGQLTLIYGTSASSPTVGGIFTLINEQRANSGKGPIGFVNPTLYANPTALNDITSGGNQGCGTSGFVSVTGWDPVTGLGTPNYPKLLQVFQSLP